MAPIRISDLGRIITGATPPTKEPYLFGSEVSFLTPSDMTFDRRHVQTKRGVSAAGAARFSTRLLPTNAVAVVCIGATIGKVCMTDGPVLTNQQVNSIVVDESRHSPDFVYYLMRTMRNRLKAVAGGAATPIVNKSSFALLEITVPGRRTQFRIGAYLKSFDDLIEINQRRIEILEEMARLLYREWFVYFRYPGHEGVELVGSEVGAIPEGWIAGKFSDLVSEITETVSPDDIGEGTPVVGLQHLPRRSTTLHDWENASHVGSRRKVFSEGDILFGKIRPYFHKVVDTPISGYSSTDAIVFRPKGEPFRSRALAVASSDEFVGVATATSNGTKMPRANTGTSDELWHSSSHPQW